MRERWRVVQGRWGGWLVWRGSYVKGAFNTWDAAYGWAREQAIYEGLGIVGIEIP